MAFTHASSVFRQGTQVKCSPPASMKDSLAPISISSRVSRQSLTKEGQTTSSLFLPRAGSDLTVASVDGFSQLSVPSLDWNDSEYCSLFKPSLSVTSFVVSLT